MYNVEIQSLCDSTNINRTLYYWARLYSSQVKDADRYTKIKPVICINLLNFKLIDATERFHTSYLIQEKYDPSLILTDHLILHYLELPKINEIVKGTHLEKWLLYFKNEGTEEETM